MILIKLGGLYLEWSNMVDAPVTYGMTAEELHYYVREEYGRRGLATLEQDIAECDAKGVVSPRYSCAEDKVAFNRAGETCLTVEQIIDYYCVRKGKGKKPRGEKL